MDNILTLHQELKGKTYKHGIYYAFKINDPKPRDIHKASVRDRIVHHAIYKNLYPHFEKQFIFDSYSCRDGKGTHRAISRFRRFGQKVSLNHTKTAWVLKCDIQKFFASIDHGILKDILAKHITDEGVLWLLSEIIDSFYTKGVVNTGLPLGNVTSQLLINVYMNEFDQFIKRKLMIKSYIRYADDFVILSRSESYLKSLIPKISAYLESKLRLTLHQDKICIKTIYSGVDFLGWIHFPFHRVLRTSTKKRMFRRLKQNHSQESFASYLGLLSHGNSFKLTQRTKNQM